MADDNPIKLIGIGRFNSTGRVLSMNVSAKCYYALRAIYALAEYQGPAP